MEKYKKKWNLFHFYKRWRKTKRKNRIFKKKRKIKKIFPQFKANNIKYSKRINMNVENWEKKEKKKRSERIQKKSK